MDHPDEVEDEERLGLLGVTRVLDRRPTSVELRLAVLAFGCLCIASIGFGLFSGEAEKFARSGGETVVVVTKTVTVPAGAPTRAPTPPPPGSPDETCSSAACVDAAGELRRTLDWSCEPCHDFAGFITARRRPQAKEVTFSEVDRTIDRMLSVKTTNHALQKIQMFHSLCSINQNPTRYTGFSALLADITNLWMNSLHSRTEKLGSVLAYLHSASFPAFFVTSAVDGNLFIQPEQVSLEGIEDVFTSIYPLEDVSQRIIAVTKLKIALDSIAKGQMTTEHLTIDELQNLSCAQPWVTCWLRWKEYYSALSSKRLVQRLQVRGVKYFVHLGRVISELSDKALESYFHWVAISTTTKIQDCRDQVQLRFGPSLLKNVFLTSELHRAYWSNQLNSARYVLRSILNLSSGAIGQPMEIESPSIDEDQTEELSLIEENNWVETVVELSRFEMRKVFNDGKHQWNVLRSDLNIVGHRIYLSMAVLQAPLSYPSSLGLPNSILFGSFGFLLVHQFRRHNIIPGEGNSCKESVRKAFQAWKQTNEMPTTEKKLIGLEDFETLEELFFLAFGRLGVICPGIEEMEEFHDAFHCNQTHTFIQKAEAVSVL